MKTPRAARGGLLLVIAYNTWYDIEMSLQYWANLFSKAGSPNDMGENQMDRKCNSPLIGKQKGYLCQGLAVAWPAARR